MPFGLPSPTELLNELPGVGSLIDTEEEKRRKRAREAAARRKPKRPERVPPSKKKEPDKTPSRSLTGRSLSRSGMGFGLPGVPKILKSAVGDVEEFARGAIPAARVIGGAIKHDAMKRDTISAKDLREYADLMRWTVADEKGDKRKRPKTDSEIIGLLAEMTRGWGRGIERALPTPFDSKDVAESKRTWMEDPLFALLDVVPFGAMIGRGASVAKGAGRIAKEQPDIGPGTALGRGFMESYRPGREARAGRKGGIKPRVARADINGKIVEEIARPWSRNPLMREMQRTYDAAIESRPGAATRRVARLQERASREEVRRTRLAATQMAKPIKDFAFTGLGKFKAAFGPRKNMTPVERARSVALMYAFQLPQNMPIADGLRAVQSDQIKTLQSGKIDLPNGKKATLKDVDKQNLSREINDIENFLKELADDPEMADQMTEALGAMKVIADRTQGMGLETMRRIHGDEKMPEIRRRWANRRSMLARRLGLAGDINAPERAAQLADLEKRLGPEQAQAGITLTDAVARAMRPDDPASFYRERVGMPSDVGAAEFVGEGMFQPGRRQVFEALVEGQEGSAYFYSPLQRALDEVMPEKATKEQYAAAIRQATTKEEIENTGIDLWLDSIPDGTPMTKGEIQNFLANPMNDYNLEEFHFRNTPDLQEQGLSTRWDTHNGGVLLAREASTGEYNEIIMRLPGEPKIPYEGAGRSHWSKDNVIAHVRFQVFEENGVRKLLVEEIQSDWSSDFRRQRKRGIDFRTPTDDDIREAGILGERIEILSQQIANLRDAKAALNERIRAEVDPAKKEPLYEIYDSYDSQIDDLKDNYYDMLDEQTKLTNAGVPPSPMGEKYHRAMLRRITREAVDENVDEIIFTDGGTQWRRNVYPDSRAPQYALDKKRPPGEQYPEGIDTATNSFYRMYEKVFPEFMQKEYGVPGNYVRDAYQGRLAFQTGDFSGVGDMGGTVFKVTDEMKMKAAQSQRLYQRQPNYDALPRGAAELLADGKTAIRMFERGDVSTWIHELGHVALHDLKADDLRVLEGSLAGGRKLEDWTRKDHEVFARSFETYVRKGYAPVPELASVFDKLKNWIGTIWARTGQRSEALSPEVKAVMDGMFEAAPSEPWGYLPHREFWDLAQSQYRGGVRPPAAGQTIGKPRLTGGTIQNNPNELLLYQTGRLSPDPAQLMDVYLNRVRFSETLQARDELWELGTPLSEGPPPKGAWLIRNPDAPPSRIGPEVKRATEMDRQRMERALATDEISTPEESMLAGNYEDFRRDYVARLEDRPIWRGDTENVRWVDGKYVNTRFGDVFESAPRGNLWSGLGMLNSLQRTAGIYGKPVAYAAGNIPFNLMALITQQPMSLMRELPRAFKLQKKGKSLFQRLVSEAGETRAGAGLPEFYTRATNRTQAAEERVSAVQRGIATGLSEYVDDPFRAAAFLRNARKKGYKSDDELNELIDANTTQTRQDLSDIRQTTREQMLDFDALNPTQRRLASQFLYLWPFIYASSKWPFMYAREYPARAALGSTVIEQEADERGPMPQQVANLFGTRWGGIDAGTFNPFGPLGDIAEGGQAFLKDPSKADLTVLQDRLAPTLGALVEGMGGGKKDLMLGLLRATVPGASELAATGSENLRGTKLFGPDRDLIDYLLQRHLRFYPRKVNMEVLKQRIEEFKKDTSDVATFDRQKQDDWDKIYKYTNAVGGYTPEDVNEITTSYNAWWNYQEATDQKKDSTGQKKLTLSQQSEILDEVVRENYPEIAGELWSSDDLGDTEWVKANEKAVEEYIDYLKNFINEGRSRVFSDYQSYGPEE